MSRPRPEHTGYREVIYIGPPPPQPRNTLGLLGFLTTFLSCGLLSPVGLIMSLLALTKAPRSFALAGTILSGLGTGLMVAAGMSGYHECEHHRNHQNTQITRQRLYEAEQLIHQETVQTEGLPTGIDGNKAILHLEDGWGNSIRYDRNDGGYVLRSAGADRRYETRDDLTLRGQALEQVTFR